MRSPLAKLIGSMVLISLSAYAIAGWEYRRPLAKWSASSLPRRRRCSGPFGDSTRLAILLCADGVQTSGVPA